MSEKRRYPQFTPEQKAEIVLAGLRGTAQGRTCAASTRSPRRCTTSGATACWRAGRRALATPRDKPPEAVELAELRKKVGQLERALGRKTYELELAGELSRDWP